MSMDELFQYKINTKHMKVRRNEFYSKCDLKQTDCFLVRLKLSPSDVCKETETRSQCLVLLHKHRENLNYRPAVGVTPDPEPHVSRSTPVQVHVSHSGGQTFIVPLCATNTRLTSFTHHPSTVRFYWCRFYESPSENVSDVGATHRHHFL